MKLMNFSPPTPRAPAGPALRVMRQRAIQAATVVLLVSTACFAIIQSLPGDIAFRIAAGRYGYDQVTAASADTVRAELGLDRPAWQQLLAWLGDLLTLDLGTSLANSACISPAASSSPPPRWPLRWLPAPQPARSLRPGPAGPWTGSPPSGSPAHGHCRPSCSGSP